MTPVRLGRASSLLAEHVAPYVEAGFGAFKLAPLGLSVAHAADVVRQINLQFGAGLVRRSDQGLDGEMACG